MFYISLSIGVRLISSVIGVSPSLGVYAGIKFFIIDFIFKSCPKLRQRYDTPFIIWTNLPTDLQLKERSNTTLSRRVGANSLKHPEIQLTDCSTVLSVVICVSLISYWWTGRSPIKPNKCFNWFKKCCTEWTYHVLTTRWQRSCIIILSCSGKYL